MTLMQNNARTIENPIRREMIITPSGSRLSVSRVRKVRIYDMHIFRERLKNMVERSGIMSKQPDAPETKDGIYRPGPVERLQMDVDYARKRILIEANRGMNYFEVPIALRDNLLANIAAFEESGKLLV